MERPEGGDVVVLTLPGCSTPQTSPHFCPPKYSRDCFVCAALLCFFSAGITAASACLSCTPGTYSGSAGALNHEISCVY